ncbi:MAG: DUF4139 domain-containing protein [Caulobacterales bacterium]
MRAWAFFLALLALAGPAAADVISAAPDSVSVTIYRDGPVNTADLSNLNAVDTNGLALVMETRTVVLPAGRSRVKFQGVADGIIPESAAVEGLPNAVRERNFDYDLLGPGSVIARSLGQTVQVVRTNRKTGKQMQAPAVLRAGPNGVVLDFGDHIEALKCSGGAEGLVFDHAPPDLADKPTLSAIVDAPAAGRFELRVSYLTVRLNWSADYVARINPDGKTLDLSGWITLANRGDVSFANAPTAVVAGNLQRVAVKLPRPPKPLVRRQCWPLGNSHHPRGVQLFVGALAAPAPGATADEVVITAGRRQQMLQDTPVAISAFTARQSELGDYKLYTLAEPTTVAARQTKQVAFLSQTGVKFETVYAHTVSAGYRGAPRGPDIEAADVVLRFDNKPAQGLGRPLPAGNVGVRRPGPDGRQLFVGDAQLERDVPIGEPFELQMGTAPDVTVTQLVTSEFKLRRGGRFVDRLEIEVDIANAMSSPATVEIRHDRAGASGFRVIAESAAHGLKAGDPLWRMTTPPTSAQTLTYTVEFDE